VAAGSRAANLKTIIGTSAHNDLDVSSYLKDMLDQILAGSTDWESLRADRWKEKHPEAVRTYRVEERRESVGRRRAHRHFRIVGTAKHYGLGVRSCRDGCCAEYLSQSPNTD
jgi:hypothetical protein